MGGGLNDKRAPAEARKQVGFQKQFSAYTNIKAYENLRK